VDKAVRQAQVQIADILAAVQQMRGPDADQPFEDAQSKGRLIISFVLEFYTISHAWDVRKQ